MLRGMNTDLGDNFVKVKTRCKRDVHFANVDLEVWSRESLQPLIDELGENVWNMGHFEFENKNILASFEINPKSIDEWKEVEAEEIILKFCSLIENLPPETRRIWNGCYKRVFDIGFESGNTENSFQTEIKAETLKRVAEIEASIVVTIYPILQYVVQSKEDFATK